jgi:hypothetical protein
LHGPWPQLPANSLFNSAVLTDIGKTVFVINKEINSNRSYKMKYNINKYLYICTINRLLLTKYFLQCVE